MQHDKQILRRNQPIKKLSLIKERDVKIHF